jgi:hypothetical protein
MAPDPKRLALFPDLAAPPAPPGAGEPAEERRGERKGRKKTREIEIEKKKRRKFRGHRRRSVELARPFRERPTGPSEIRIPTKVYI